MAIIITLDLLYNNFNFIIINLLDEKDKDINKILQVIIATKVKNINK